MYEYGIDKHTLLAVFYSIAKAGVVINVKDDKYIT
jgi:hypothetical protein